MGQCYSVSAKFKYNEAEQFRQQLIKSMQSQNCNWHIDDWEFISIEELLRSFLYEMRISVKQLKNGSFEFSVLSDFNQSYSWESLMIEIFEELTPVLRNGSYLTIYPDSDYDRYVIKNGKCVQTH